MALDNKEIYKKTLGFSLRRFGWDVVAFVAFVAMMGLGLLIASVAKGSVALWLIIGAIVGAVLVYFLLRYVSYTYKAGQIAMMTRGIVDGKLPEDVIGEGKKIVKERFVTVAVYYAATSAIKGIFSQIGKGITSVGNAVGGDTGGAIGSAISSILDTIVRYLCDCCLGWVFYRKDTGSGKATCEGAVLFFKHGKTFFKNMGRVFGISIVSFLVIGGVFMGISYLIMMNYPDVFQQLAAALAEEGEAMDANTVMLICSAGVGVIFWSMLHSVFVRPFILVGVLRNFINSGIEEKPNEKDFDELDSKSSKFKKLHSEIAGAK